MGPHSAARLDPCAHGWMPVRRYASIRGRYAGLRGMAASRSWRIVACTERAGACRCVVRADVYRHVPVSGERPSRPASEIV
ncbi:hypothetical protein DP59_5784 [Burkholderia pseudomallei]|nr:hypothetical protein DP59_5784 [Burkholderia pseudomallei]